MTVHEDVAVTAPMLTPTRDSVGTSWLPEVTPMYGLHRAWRGWDVRLDGLVFVQAIYEPRERHRTGGVATRQASSVNWLMVGARRTVAAGGRVGMRAMLSADALTMSDCGAIGFLATGEVCEGDTVHDRQQPHDLFMELAADIEHPLRGSWNWQLYAGLAGDPALGPPGYQHRASAMSNPVAPVAHHWLDSTQVTFGVVTVAVHNRRWKAESSFFKGRSPDERRTDLDLGAFDSASARLSFLPSPHWALQVSAARLRDVSTDFPLRSPQRLTRVTASAIRHVTVGGGGLWATTVAMGVNRATEVATSGLLGATTAAALLESSVSWSRRHTAFFRAEVADMPAHHLHAHEYGTSALPVWKVQIGYSHQLRTSGAIVPGIGGSAALSVLPPELAPRYYGRIAPSVGVFFTLQPARHQM
ncbi:MAG: hypothetical protein AB7I50_14315 [Vicinamibacterales bacterium]